mgnify:CR=1 FL=1
MMWQRTIPALVCVCLLMATAAMGDGRLRVIFETDAGGDQDDQASLVRLLMYSNDFDIQGIIAERHPSQYGKDGAFNDAGTGAANSLELVRDYIEAHGGVRAKLVKHDPRYPTMNELLSRTVAAHNDTQDGVNLIINRVDASNEPLWYGNWGSNSGTTSNLKRALDKCLR